MGPTHLINNLGEPRAVHARSVDLHSCLDSPWNWSIPREGYRGDVRLSGAVFLGKPPPASTIKGLCGLVQSQSEMVPLYSALFLLFVSSAFGQKPVTADLEGFIDNMAAGHNAMLTARGIESVKLEKGTSEGISFSQGLQHHVNTMKRTGKGTVQRTGDSISYKYPLGYENLAFSFDSITFEDGSKVEKPRLEVKGPQQFVFDFTLTERPECKVTLDEYKFIRLEGIQAQGNSLTPDQLAKVSRVLLDHVNSSIEKKKKGVEQHLQPLCHPNKDIPSHHG